MTSSSESDLNLKRKAFSDALYANMAPCISDVDRVVRGVFASQDELIGQLGRLEIVLNSWKKRHAQMKKENAKNIKLEKYVHKLDLMKLKINDIDKKMNQVNQRIIGIQEMVTKKQLSKK